MERGIAMSRTVVRPRSALGAKLLLISLMVWPLSPVALADSTSTTTFSGRATVVRATAPVVGTIVLSDTGDLPSSGGAQEASLLSVSEPGLLTADTLHATTIGQGNSSQSEASVASLTLTAGG